MGDGPQSPEHETEGRAARRVLRVARLRTTGGRPRRKWWAGAVGVTVMALLAAGLWKQAPPPPGERAADNGAGQVQDAARDAGAAVAADAPLEATIEVVAAPAPRQRAEEVADRPLARPAPAPVDLSSFDAAAGLRIVNAAAGNPFGLRASDVIVDLCDRPGRESALDMSHALATDASSCLMVMRDNVLVRAELGAPASGEAKPRDGRTRAEL